MGIRDGDTDDDINIKRSKMPECSSACGCMHTETPKEEKIIKCPKCHINMIKLSNGKYVIDKCPKCEGIFLDKNEIDVAHKIGFMTYVMDYFRKDKHPKKNKK